RPLLSTALFFRPEYGFDDLVEGLVRLRLRHPELGCIVMGTGEQRADAERRVYEAGLRDQILMLGDVGHDTCLRVISSSDVLLRATREDGDSISVREALSLGTPVVASAVGTRPSGAILFQPGNVEQMVSKIELALEIRKHKRPQAEGSMDRLIEI